MLSTSTGGECENKTKVWEKKVNIFSKWKIGARVVLVFFIFAEESYLELGFVGFGVNNAHGRWNLGVQRS